MIVSERTYVLVRGFPAQAFATNCYVVAPAAGGPCVVVDPGIGVEEQLDGLLREHDLSPVAVLLTHGHLDHTFSVTPVCGARDIPAYIHPADDILLTDPMRGLSAESSAVFGGRLTWTRPSDVALLEPGQPLELAGLRLSIDFTPGHTPGSVVFRLPGDRLPGDRLPGDRLPGDRLPGDEAGGEAGAPILLSGDVLFAGSIGRTDLPGGDWGQMQRSLSQVVLALADDTVVLPGHGPATTIGRERATNPFLRDLAPAPSRGL